MIFNRKIARSIFKSAMKTNRIRRAWRKLQIDKYGISTWCRMYNHSVCNNKTNYITPENAMKI